MIEVNNILVLQEAAEDIIQGKQFYNRQQEGVGEYFRESLLADIESLRLYAGVHELHNANYRMLSKRFPYAIYYQIKQHTVYVIAILPMRRSPEGLKELIQDRH